VLASPQTINRNYSDSPQSDSPNHWVKILIQLFKPTYSVEGLNCKTAFPLTSAIHSELPDAARQDATP